MPLTDGFAAAAVAAGATTNLFAGRPIEFLGVASNVRLFIVADAALVTCQVLINQGGNQLAPIASGTTVNVASVAGAGPKEDEDRMADFAVPAGARLQLNSTNGGAGATNIRFRALITP